MDKMSYGGKGSASTLVKKGVTECTPITESTAACGMDSKGPNEKPMGIAKSNVKGNGKSFHFR